MLTVNMSVLNPYRYNIFPYEIFIWKRETELEKRKKYSFSFG